jgi:hypothetical protein
MRTLAMMTVIASALFFGACNAANNGGGMNSRIPAEPMPGSPAAQMQQQQAPQSGAPGATAPR